MKVYHSIIRLNMLFCFLFYILPLAVHTEAASVPHILVLSETNGWDHLTRIVADSVINALGHTNGFEVTTTNSTDGYFTGEYLATCSAVCFINTTGTIFTDEEATAFERYMLSGGGYIGVHASTDCEYDRVWYAQMTGANFNGHPFNIAEAKVAVLDRKHPSTNFISEDTLTRTDEWYFWADNPAFQNNPLVDPAENDSVSVLMELIESSIDGSALNHFHPICWYKSYGSGRVWYCGFGHDPETFKEPLMKKMLLGGIRYAAGIQITKSAFKPYAVENSTARTDIINVYDCLGRVLRSFRIAGTPDVSLPANMTTAKGVYITVRQSGKGTNLRQRIGFR